MEIKRKSGGGVRFDLALAVLCAVLALSLAITTALLADRLLAHTPSDSGAIALIPESSGPVTPVTAAPTGPAPTESVTTSPPEAAPRPTAPAAAPGNPGFTAEDEQQTWSTQTRAEIFRIRYEETGAVTVLSGGGDRVFAPGTGNSYTFQFKNNGDVALNYAVTVRSYTQPGDVVLPLVARLNRHDGVWLTGDDGGEGWTPVLALDGVTDSGALSPNYSMFYTLQWQWPFETADENGDVSEGDAYDTWLGNLAAEEDLTLTVEIDVIATASTDPGAGGGLPPKTGDNSHIWLAVAVAVVSFVMLVILLAARPGKKKDNRKHENTETADGKKE